jgi:hypothetical protein
VVRTFLEAVREEKYSDAYAELCDSITERVTLADFERVYGAEKLESYVVGAINATNTITVDATLTWEDRGAVEARYTLVPAAPVLKICGGI